MFLIGPGIKPGEVLTDPYSLEDIATTVAYALGVDMPNADGLVIAGAFETPPSSAGRSGDVRPSVAGGRRAVQRFNSDPWTRSEVWVDDDLISSDGVIAEEPVLMDTSAGTFVCWRELEIAVSSDDIDWPWTARCAARVGTAWEDIGFPVEDVWPLFTASMAGDGDNLIVSWADNSNATTYSDTRGGIRLARWDTATESWDVPDGFEGELYPNNPSLTIHDGGPFLAWAASDTTGDSTDAGRYTRHIVVARVTWPDEEPTYTEIFRTYASGCPAEEAKCPDQEPTVDAEGYTYDRMEAATLTDLGDGLGLAFLGYGNDVGNTVVVTTSDDSGDLWQTPVRVDDSGRVFGHINPSWIGSTLVWARLSATDTVEVCRAVYQADAECVDTGAARIMGLGNDGSVVVASLDRGLAEWTVEAIEW